MDKIIAMKMKHNNKTKSTVDATWKKALTKQGIHQDN